MRKRTGCPQALDKAEHGAAEGFAMKRLADRESDFGEFCIHSTSRTVGAHELIETVDLRLEIPGKGLCGLKKLLLHRKLRL
jgi:hypothetical protein